MAVTYVRRFRMELDLETRRPAPPRLPEGYAVFAWPTSETIAEASAGPSVEAPVEPQSGDLSRRHASVKWRSFAGELDSRVFPSLGEPTGCDRLMRSICEQPQFIPQATLLLCWNAEPDDPASPADPAPLPLDSTVWEDCGTIQCLGRLRTAPAGAGGVTNRHAQADRTMGTAAIQNVGIVPEHRGCGMGRAIVEHCLAALYTTGFDRVSLEVTAANDRAVALYESLGFRLRRTVYKPVKLPRRTAALFG